MMDKRRALLVFLLVLGIICILVGIIGYVTNGNWLFIIPIVFGGICLVFVIWLFIAENIKKR